jgi:uncharacterized RDD family membrane protein YckC
MPGSPVGPSDETTNGHPGQRFGLPESGVGSVAGFGRRLGGVTIDWLLCYLIAMLFAGADAFGRGSSLGWTIWLVWFGVTSVAIAIFGVTPGMFALGMRAAPIDDRPVVGVPRALLRTLLLGLVVPALVRDADGRGYHDRAAGTVVIRTR